MLKLNVVNGGKQLGRGRRKNLKGRGAFSKVSRESKRKGEEDPRGERGGGGGVVGGGGGK